MAQVFPTKANLMATQKSLDLAKLGYELMDRKRANSRGKQYPVRQGFMR